MRTQLEIKKLTQSDVDLKELTTSKANLLTRNLIFVLWRK